MKKIIALLGTIAALLCILFLYNSYVYTTVQPPLPSQSSARMTLKPVEIVPIEHATAAIRWGDKVLYIDPIGGADKFAGQSAANIVLITDIHSDHLDAGTLAAVLGNASLIVPQAVKDELPAELAVKAKVLTNDETINEQGFSITGIPMYNHPEAENARFHTKGRGNGYVIERDGFRVYIAGDTAGTPEMRALQNIDIALIPMNLPYTMSVEEAADAVIAFKPKIVYPYHYRGTDGLSDVARFKQLVNEKNRDIQVILAEWYHN